MTQRFVFAEPSKVRTYHITLIEGYLRALKALPGIDLVCACGDSLRENLSADVRAGLTWQRVPVIDQDKHQVVRKSLVEFWVLAKLLFQLRRGDVLFISCTMPTALLLLELLNRLLRKTGIFVVVHGEIEALFESAAMGPLSIGFWARQWLRLRGRGSRIAVVGIDDFITRSLASAFPDKLPASKLFVAHHAITPAPVAAAAGHSVCFIGYRTASKGFEIFRSAAARHPDIRFLAIGMGKIEDLRDGAVTPLSGNSDYLAAIAGCAAAVFPYTRGYDHSLSAAVLDAISAGVHIIASDRASFAHLQSTLGADFVTLVTAPADLDGCLSTPGWLQARAAGQAARRMGLQNTVYGAASLARDFAHIAAAAS